MEPYGSKHCRCWVEDAGTPGEHWLPNAACYHHGIMTDYAAPPKDTGTYRVFPIGTKKFPERPAGPHWNRWGEYVEPEPVTKNWRLEGGRLVADVVTPAQGCSCSVNEADPCAYCAAVTEALAVAHTTEEEPQRGVRATVQRWWRDFRRGTGWRL
jgi:hypothetical protein